jgi:transposase
MTVGHIHTTGKEPPIVAIIAQIYSFVIGVDTHAKEHVLSILEPNGELLETKSFRTNSLNAAINWVGKLTLGDSSVLWVIEGVATYGATLAAEVSLAGFTVVEAPRMNTRANRGMGKTDTLDSQRIAAAALPLDEAKMRLPRLHEGTRVALQLLVTSRDQMTTERTGAINQLTAILRQWNLGVDARRPLTAAQILEISKWGRRQFKDVGIATAYSEANRIAKRITTLTSEITANLQKIEALVKGSMAAVLLKLSGIGPITAAVIYCAWSHYGRVPTADAFKSLAGVSPIPASSGNTTRYRLNRGGDRRLNSAVHMATISQEIHDSETKAYIAKRLAEGKTRKEIRRCLKSYIIRRAYRALNAAARQEIADAKSLSLAA